MPLKLLLKSELHALNTLKGNKSWSLVGGFILDIDKTSWN